MGKQLVDFITCSCETNALFFVIYKIVLVIGLYKLLGNPTTKLNVQWKKDKMTNNDLQNIHMKLKTE